MRMEQRLYLLVAAACVVSACSGDVSGPAQDSAADAQGDSQLPGTAAASVTPLSKDYGYNPTVAVPADSQGNIVYAAWEGLLQGIPYLFFTRSLDGGMTFEEPRPIFPASPGGSRPVLAAVENRVFLVWAGAVRLGAAGILMSMSEEAGALGPDRGESFLAPVRVSDPMRVAANPSIAATPQAVLVAWLDLDAAETSIRFRAYRKDPELGSMLQPDPIGVLSESGAVTGRPALASDSETAWVAWEDFLRIQEDPKQTEPSEILSVRSTNGGRSFSSPPTNLSETPGNSMRPVMAVSDGVLHVVWEDFSENNASVLIPVRSTDGGETFEAVAIPLFLSGSTTTGHGLAARGQHVYLTWPGRDPGSGTRQIFFTRSVTGGSTFGPPFNLSLNPESAQNPAVAAGPDRVFVVWEGQMEIGPGESQRQIFLGRLQAYH